MGDRAIDRYHWCNARPFNPEGPTPIMDLQYTTDQPGMAANVAENLRAFQPQTLDCRFGRETSIKNRYMDCRSRRCMLRVDQDIESPALELPDNLDSYDAVIISDYNKGSITLDLVKRIRAGYNGPIFIDTKIRDLAQLHGCIVKINEREYTARISDHDNVIVTRGELGVSYADQHYAAPMVDARDVCGAGDTFLAGLVAGYLLQHDIESAIKIALSASAEAVRHVGTHSLTIQDAVAICESL